MFIVTYNIVLNFFNALVLFPMQNCQLLTSWDLVYFLLCLSQYLDISTLCRAPCIEGLGIYLLNRIEFIIHSNRHGDTIIQSRMSTDVNQRRHTLYLYSIVLAQSTTSLLYLMGSDIMLRMLYIFWAVFHCTAISEFVSPCAYWWRFELLPDLNNY